MPRTVQRNLTGIDNSASIAASAPPGTVLLGLALLSASGMALEFVLIRVFSVVLLNHIAYAALGVVIAGLGIGAAAAAVIDRQD